MGCSMLYDDSIDTMGRVNKNCTVSKLPYFIALERQLLAISSVYSPPLSNKTYFWCSLLTLKWSKLFAIIQAEKGVAGIVLSIICE